MIRNNPLSQPVRVIFALFLFGSLLLLTSSAMAQMWGVQYVYTHPQYYGVTCIDTNNVWVVGGAGTVVHTTNGGVLWSGQYTGVFAPLNAIAFTNASKGCAVGGVAGIGLAATIVRTTNGGTNWTGATCTVYDDLVSVAYADSNNLWAVGRSGEITHSINGGANWTNQTSGTINTLNSVAFASDSIGWIVGGVQATNTGIILHTTNGGRTWTPQTDSTSGMLSCIVCLDTSHAWASGGGGEMLHTTNGGATWINQPIATAASISAMTFVNANFGCAVGQNGLLSGFLFRKTNAGSAWITDTDPSNNALYAVAFSGTNNGWAVGNNGTILYYYGGTIAAPVLNSPPNDTANLTLPVVLNWGTVPNALNYEVQVSTDTNFTTLIVDSTITGTAINLTNLSYTTRYYWRVIGYYRGVGTWSARLSFSTLGIPAQSPTPRTPANLNSNVTVPTIFHWGSVPFGSSYRLQVSTTSSFANTVVDSTIADSSIMLPSLAYFTVYYWRVRSNNVVGSGPWSGTRSFLTMINPNWIRQYSGTANHLVGVCFTDENYGWAVGWSGTILHTTNGGATWVGQTSGTIYNLNAVKFVNHNDGWVVGDVGTILNTTNGGNTWLNDTSRTIAELHGIAFSDTNYGWAVGDSGKILRTTNGGTTWQSQNSTTTNNLYNIASTLANIGWAVGTNGTIRHTTNGGITWLNDDYGSSILLMDVMFIDVNNGWAVGYNNLLNTTNGATWVSRTAPANALRCITFTSTGNGWVAGDGGELAHTTNSGATWAAETGLSAYNFYGVSFPDSNNGWVVGTNGCILKYTYLNNAVWQPDEQLPIGFSLHQNYPNPFNSFTTIEYSLPHNSSTKLELFDLLGRSVRTLVNTSQNAGTYRVHFDATNLSSGEYFYRLSSGNFVETRKLMYIK